MIATTIINSINVKPRALTFEVLMSWPGWLFV